MGNARVRFDTAFVSACHLVLYFNPYANQLQRRVRRALIHRRNDGYAKDGITDGSRRDSLRGSPLWKARYGIETGTGYQRHTRKPHSYGNAQRRGRRPSRSFGAEQRPDARRRRAPAWPANTAIDASLQPTGPIRYPSWPMRLRVNVSTVQTICERTLAVPSTLPIRRALAPTSRNSPLAASIA